MSRAKRRAARRIAPTSKVIDVKGQSPAPALYAKEYAALHGAYGLLLSGAGLLRTAEAAIESGAEGLSRGAVSETAFTALKKLNDAHELLEFSHTDSPLLEHIENARKSLWDVLDLVFVASHVLKGATVSLPDQSAEDADDRPVSEHPESALLRVAAEMTAGDGPGSVAAKVARLQQRIREGGAPTAVSMAKQSTRSDAEERHASA